MTSLYRSASLALLTDLYEVTMAYGYWKSKMAETEAIFYLFFRKSPFKGGLAIAAGLEAIVDYIKSYRFETSDLDYLATLKNPSGTELFEDGFLKYLEKMRFTCDIDIVPEGEVVFPYEPLLRIQGPIIQCQLLEPAFLDLINFPTLIATKASRIVRAARGDPVLEFGLRRAQGIDGAITASRSAFVGGCTSTSNVLAGKLFGIPVSGTHAHSWVMAFDAEIDAFYAYAQAMSDNVVLLVDTYDTIAGTKRAIEVGRWLKNMGKKLLGIRLDSGDLETLSKAARKLLDEAGFSDTKIYASNELDEVNIDSLKEKQAPISVWGVGTHLVTGGTQAALDGVYKLSAVKNKGEGWKSRLKLSEKLSKVSDPGNLQVKRFYQAGVCIGDAIYEQTMEPSAWEIIDIVDSKLSKKMPANAEKRDLLVPVFRRGQQVYKLPALKEIQDYARNELSQFPEAIQLLAPKERYFVGHEKALFNLKTQLMQQASKECE